VAPGEGEAHRGLDIAGGGGILVVAGEANGLLQQLHDGHGFGGDDDVG